MYMPLGNLYLAAAAKRAGFVVTIADFRDRVLELPKARYYGFSCTTPQITIAKQLAKRVHGKTIIGGAHPSLLPQDCEGYFDYVVRGEGEDILIDIIRNTLQPGTYRTKRIGTLDGIPLPAWDLVDNCFSTSLYAGERYGYGEKSMAVITSRGCPYNCAFCGNHLRAPVTFRSVQNIKKEIMELLRRDVSHLRFVDDNFTLHPQFDELCAMLKQAGVKYRCHSRSNLITKPMAYLMKDSGCEECSIGVESADDKVLKLNNKGEVAERHGKALRILQGAGLATKVYLMSGLPGETDDSIELTKQFMIDYKPTKWTLSTFTPYPGCAIFNNPEKFGIKIINPHWENWWNFVYNVRDLDLPDRKGYVHQLEGQTLEDMKRRHDNLYYFLYRGDWER
jgi:radical SAM superfamily enzyme YgiQ (UPF0313 family)